MKAPGEIELAIFDVAIALADGAPRRSFLDEVCAGNPERRKRLERLLAIHGQADSFFKGAALALALPAESLAAALPAKGETGNATLPASGEQPGAWIGRYKLVEKIGEGGGGVVWLAEQHEPVRRTVALKVIRLGMDTESVIARFEIERQSLALMDHPNIARVLEAGATAAGRPFFVMEWVRGSPITGYCDENRLNLRQRIRLFIQVCHAIQHAHQKGVIHRDIKPSNILVASHDGKPEPKVIDFGIAKAATGQEPLENANTSSRGFWLGTPAYMSPEQADEKAIDIDTRSDVYSLGILLYELLAGRTPYNAKELADVGVSEARRIPIEREPALPSVMLAVSPPEKLAAIAGHRNSAPHKLISAVRGDLDGVVMKAISKDRTRRYDTANGLALDLQRFLNDEPVYASPPSCLYVARKFILRNRLAVLSVAAVATAIILGLGFSIWAFSNERIARQEQSRLRNIAEVSRAAESALRERVTLRANISRAAVLLSEGNVDEADELLRKNPLGEIDPSREAADVLRSLGMRNAVRGRWKESLDCYNLLFRANRFDTSQSIIQGQDLLPPGPIWIEQGDFDGYERFRALVLSNYSDTSDMQVAEQVIKVTMLRQPDAAILARIAALQGRMEKSMATENSPGLAAWRAFALALLEYRKGNIQATIEWGERVLKTQPLDLTLVAMTKSLVAMARFRVGDSKQARDDRMIANQLIGAAFSQKLSPDFVAQGPAAGYWWDWLIARILLREAEASLASTPATGQR